MKLYILMATAYLHEDIGFIGKFMCISKKVFHTYEEAKIYEPEFFQKCITPRGELDLHYADPKSLKIVIGELELIE